MNQESQVVATPPGRPAAVRKDVSIKSMVVRKQRVSGEDFHRLIAEAAYFRAEQRGFVPGSELEDWLTAELEITVLYEADDGQA